MSESTWSVINAMSKSHRWEVSAAELTRASAATARRVTHDAAVRVCATCHDDFDSPIRYCPGVVDAGPTLFQPTEVPLPGFDLENVTVTR